MIKKIQITVDAVYCDKCGVDTEKYNGHGCIYDDENNKQYCYTCALKLGLMGALDWLRIHGICFYDKASYKDGKIIAFRKWGRGYTKDVLDIEE